LRRVVITGIGAVSPIGLSAKETWGNALEGKSGIGQITLFDTKDCPVTIAGEVKGYDFTRDGDRAVFRVEQRDLSDARFPFERVSPSFLGRKPDWADGSNARDDYSAH